MKPVRFAAAALISLTLTATGAHARGQSLTLTAGLGSAYDDNFLQYSANQLSAFEAGTRPSQFSIKTRDDQLWLPSLALAVDADRGHGRRSQLTLRGSGEYHSRNGTADHGSGSLAWRESFGAGRRLTVSAYRLPGFYLRQLIADDAVVAFPGLSKYRRAEFDLTTLGAKYRQRVVEGLAVELGYQHEQRDYVPDFAERTSGLHQETLALDWTGPKDVALGAGVSFQSSKARAGDGDDAVTPLDDVDVSYHGIAFDGDARWRIVRGPGFQLEGVFSAQTEGRTYDSDRIADRYHYGRVDQRWRIEPSLRLSWRRRWGARLAYLHEHNDARLGSAASASADAGTYTENRVGFSIDWNGQVWHSHTSTEPE